MKFGEKYELLESLTTGGVETFVANDKVRGQRVLVHILECEAQKPNQPTVQWVLEAFRRVAPEPAGLVLETGRYSGTLYAYLVTKMPDEAALANWVLLYKAQGRDTQEIPSPVAKPSPESEAPTANLTSKETSPVVGSMTQLLREFDPQAKPAGSSVPSKQTEQPSQPLPNVKSAPERSAVHPAPDWDAMTPRISPAKVEPNIGSSESFSSAFAPRNVVSETNSPTIKDGPRPGEFTNFFQGPFRVEGPSEIPALSPQQMEPPRKTVGDFTAMFNPPRPEEPLPAAGVAGNEPPGAGFTGWFNTPNIVSRTSGTAAAAPPSELQRSVIDDASVFPAPAKDPFVPPQPASYVVPTANCLGSDTTGLPDSAASKSGDRKAACRPSDSFCFRRRHERIQSPGQRTHSCPAGASKRSESVHASHFCETSGGPCRGTEASFAKFAGDAHVSRGFHAAPSRDSSPAYAARSAMPKIAVPPGPKPPKVAIPEPPVSYWPLILTLTVLFFIAVLLVLYFALKH